MMHGNVPTEGIQIKAILAALRFEGGVGKMALTLVPSKISKWCRGWDLNPRRPSPEDLKSSPLS